MKLTIVYDNEIYKKGIGLKSDWGFSCLIETKDETTLFDTGAKAKILLNNMKILGIDPCVINKIVISHEHWDHNGGLETLGSIIGDVELYRLGKEQPSENMKLITVEKPQEITEGIYTTGKLTGMPVDEQSLVLKGENGWYVLTGCSHPGVETIFDAARQYGNVIGLVGGLHGFDNFPVLDGLRLVCAAHCSKYKKKIHELLPDISIKAGVGKIIEI